MNHRERKALAKVLSAVVTASVSTMAMAAPAKAPQVAFEIVSRSIAYDGRTFGQHGAYETISAVARMRIDPHAPENRGIVDLGRAPRGPDGMVAYDVDVTILRPADARRARRVMVYEVLNRGMKLMPMLLGGSSGGRSDPIDPGDGLLLRDGYTLVWSGWQGDIAGNDMIGRPLMGARFPVATDRGKPLTGRVSTETIFENLTGNRIALPYPAATLDKAGARLTVRATADSPAIPLPATDWQFADARTVTVTRPASMDAGAIYRFAYTARDPRVMGLGFAATRDLVSWLRHAPAALGNPLADIGSARCEPALAGQGDAAEGPCINPAGGHYSAAVAFGLSQSGRYLRDFVYQGFNRDNAGRRVFDGMIAAIPGARRTFTNARFAEPGRFSRQHEDHDVPGFDFPFAYSTLADPASKRRDGILKACSADDTCPRLFHVDTSAEFWQAGASLVGTGGTAADLAFPDTVRAYMIAGSAHAPGLGGPMCRYPANPFNPAPAFRALAVAMIDWALDRRLPPPSQWPRVAAGDLVGVADLRPPMMPGVDWPRVVNRPAAAAGAKAWPVLVPAIDADGNDRPGIRLPQIAVPTGTYLGWNLRKPGYGEGDLCFLAGSYLGFADDAASRGADPRPSLAKRHADAAARSADIAAAARQLVGQRLLLADDAAQMIAQTGHPASLPSPRPR